MTAFEVIANGINAVSVVLAARNSVHTWWTGVIGCVLFGILFFGAQLYADATLQIFFIMTCLFGWLKWTKGDEGAPAPVKRSGARLLSLMAGSGVLVTLAYGFLLHVYTDAYAPFLDSTVLAFSVLGQLLLMQRRIETWWCWILVDIIAVPLFASRGLYVTSVLYAAFLANAVFGLLRWKREMRKA
ncbi:nicotinamide riboside transporter PnuC [Coraliomargarita sp. SDUM461003]|uniref:Nicotinamide riboside transporter PnuC n=2 Tax=Thalassobacterium TaxID=3410851 RepID=A0ABU1AUQ3_9BACT|nr:MULTISPECIES: nicotinamide riboside transporter PnuC [unclassified Coraliomargarita]MDQ8195872.1 nicotinamide riboside transporter PnuC [Coraliomargarita sp. SDUM461004]MDQ8207884.1 nicotinamide riboside transporter PnuC [Coraliomargarita sp. SDUM461003]